MPGRCQPHKSHYSNITWLTSGDKWDKKKKMKKKKMNDSWGEMTWELNMEKKILNIPCEACRCKKQIKPGSGGDWWGWRAVGRRWGRGGGKLRSAMPSDALRRSLSSASWWLKPPVHLKVITRWRAEVARTCNHPIRKGPLYPMILHRALLIVTWAPSLPVAGVQLSADIHLASFSRSSG